MRFSEKLEFHYYLKELSHSMDAIVRNKCEAEALAVFIEASKILGIPFSIESSARLEGGIREIWDFIGKNNNQLTLLLAVVVLLFSRIPVSDPEMDPLNKEVAKLTIEEKKLTIEKLKRESLAEKQSSSTVYECVSILESNIKIAVRRSNFYRVLGDYEKVTGLAVTRLAPESPEYYVDKSEFSKFVLATNKLPVEVVEYAVIEIVAPVLKEGNYQWKGIYNGEPISFAMNDSDFKKAVLNRKVTFQHGTTITVVLNIHRKFDEVGDVTITGFSVSTVVSIADGVLETETVQGKRYKENKWFSESQGNLF